MRWPGADRVFLALSFTLRIVILLALISALANTRWTVAFVSGLALLMTFLPSLFERNYRISLPAEFEIVIVLFIYTAIFLGEVHGYYTRFWWWDLILHASSGIVLGFIGFLMLYVLYAEKKIRAKPLTICFFSFCFAMAIGALWEIFEFAMDSSFGLNMQKSGLSDTMWDLIVDAAGAIVASGLGFLYLKGRRSRMFGKVLEDFRKENPSLFGPT